MNHHLNKPQVSIIFPVYNGEKSLLKSINSVREQTYQDWELLVVDDASTDSSVERIKMISNYDNRIRLFKMQRNSGAAVARNTAIERAEGRFIAFLDCDDIWFPNKLEQQLSFMQQSKTAFSFTAYSRIHESGEILTTIGVPESLTYKDLLNTCYIGCLTVIYDTHYYGKRFMPLIRQGQDYALWLDLLRCNQEARGLNETLAIYQVRENSLSAKKIKGSTYIWYIYRNFEHFSFLKASYYFANYALRGILRSKFPNIALFLGFLHSASAKNYIFFLLFIINCVINEFFYKNFLNL
jgi:glycosyltransferase involved in cell wall biosynthesis